MNCPFTTKRLIKENQLECWDSNIIEIFNNDIKCGEFERNYYSYGTSTFAPFFKNDQWYALCSPDYTAISIMSLPDCKIIGGETPHSFGFCPVEIWVPKYKELLTPALSKEELVKYPECNHVWLSRDRISRVYDEQDGDKYEDFAIICGCIWGDDTSWKLEIRDLSKADEGIISSIDSFGYYPLWPMALQDCVILNSFECFVDEYPQSYKVHITMAVQRHIKLFREDSLKYKDFGVE